MYFIMLLFHVLKGLLHMTSDEDRIYSNWLYRIVTYCIISPFCKNLICLKPYHYQHIELLYNVLILQGIWSNWYISNWNSLRRFLIEEEDRDDSDDEELVVQEGNNQPMPPKLLCNELGWWYPLAQTSSLYTFICQ